MTGKICQKSKWPYYKTDQFCIFADCRIIPHGFCPLSLGSCCCKTKPSKAPSSVVPKRESRSLKAGNWFPLPGFLKKERFLHLGERQMCKSVPDSVVLKTGRKLKESLLCVLWPLIFFPPALLHFYSARILPNCM